MSAAPAFAAVPRLAIAQVTVANTARDGSGNIATVFTAGPSGSRIERVRVHGVGTTTTGVVRLFVHDGTNARLFKEILVPAITPSTSVAAFDAEVDLSDAARLLVLPAGYSLRAATNNAETFNVFAVGGDY